MKKQLLLGTEKCISTPKVGGAVGWGDLDYDYIQNIFRPAFIKAVEAAISKAEPVKMGIACGNSDIGTS